MPKFRIIDYETENQEWYGELASPRNPENYIVMAGWRDAVLAGDGWKFGPRKELRYNSAEEYRAEYRLDLDGIDVLVAHNAPYEMMWWLENHRAEFEAFLKRGGRVFCTAYAEYLLTHQQSMYPALNEVAPLYGGTHKVDAVKAMWDAGYKTSEIDKELLSEYLSGPRGDIENTTKILVGQWAAMTKSGMLKMAMMRMEGMLMWACMMGNGLHINRELAEANRKELAEHVAGLTVEILKLLPADMPAEAREQFKTTSAYHLSAFVFGGVMKYRTTEERRDKDGKPIMAKVDGAVFIDGKTPYSKALTECEFDEESGLWYDPEKRIHQTRYVRGKNAGEPKFDRVDGAQIDTRQCFALYTMPGLLRHNDRRAKEISENMAWENVRRPGEWVGKRKLADGSPVFSTAGEVLEILAARKIPGVTLLAERAAAQKILGTYYLVEEVEETEDEATGEVTTRVVGQSGMLQYLQPDDIVHHILNTTGTETTRLSSMKPNFQNIPQARKANVKTIFTSRFENGRIVEADYKSLETMGQCVFTKDKNLTKFILKDIDMHSMRLASWRHEDYDFILEQVKNEEAARHAEYDGYRSDIKPKVFAYSYGATARGIAYSTGCDEQEAQEFIDNEKRLFPEVESWYTDYMFPLVEQNGQTHVHREMLPDNRWQAYHRGYFEAPSRTCYSFRQYSSWSSAARSYIMQYKPTQMRNYPIQGETAFWVQAIGGLVYRWLLSNDFFGGRVCPMNAVHDALYFDTAPDCPQEFFVGLKAIMQSIPEYMNHHFPEYQMHIPFPVDIKAGASMAEEKGVAIDAEEVAAFKAAYLGRKGIRNELYKPEWLEEILNDK